MDCHILRALCIIACLTTVTTRQDASIWDGIIGAFRDINEIESNEPPDVEQILPEYDFIIIGAGTAGCVLGNRLSEVKKFKVLLIEAGDREQAFMDIPVLATLLQFTEANWNYHTEPQMPHQRLLPLVMFIVTFCVLESSSQVADPITSIFHFLRDGVDQLETEPPDQTKLLKEYDFIIVGAGTAGCVLANRLTEISDWKVLLIEAGMNENFIMDIPLVANYIQFTQANWKYKTQPSNRYCAGFQNRQCLWPRGKVVGGSSVLNYMIYTRGAPQDYNQWRDMGNEGWAWDDVLPYFKKIENFNIRSFYNPEYHSQSGYLNVEYCPFRSKKGKAWVKGAQELGFIYGDHNGANHAGVSFLQLSMKNGTRHSSSRAYLHPISKRNNLHLAKGAMVTKLIMNDDKTRAIGVEMEKYGIKYKILAKKEVIVSAGAINSPQLLMLSGIGPQDHLRTLNIPVIKDLPVGYNLQDHIAAGGLQFVVNEQGLTLSTEYMLTHLEYVFRWMKTHKGPLSIPGGCEALVFLELQDKFNKTGWPDLELLFISGGLNSDPALKNNFGFDNKIYSETYGPLGKQDTFMVFPMLMRPKSKGRVKLSSRNPYAHPILIPNYFEYKEDLKKIVEGIKIAIEISKQASMTTIGTKVYDVPIQECLNFGPFGSDEYFQCQAQMFTFTIYHQSGTCKMGPVEDPTSVVDPRLRVKGVRNLRVVDASIIPIIPSSHTNSPVFMIAEKASDMIKEDWGRL